MLFHFAIQYKTYISNDTRKLSHICTYEKTLNMITVLDKKMQLQNGYLPKNSKWKTFLCSHAIKNKKYRHALCLKSG